MKEESAIQRSAFTGSMEQSKRWKRRYDSLTRRGIQRTCFNVSASTAVQGIVIISVAGLSLILVNEKLCVSENDAFKSFTDCRV